MKAWLVACILGLGLQSPALPSQTEWRLGSPPGVYAMDANGKATLADGASLGGVAEMARFGEGLEVAQLSK